LASTTCELQWLSYLFRDLHIVPQDHCSFFWDNKSALHLAANHVFHERGKHIEIDCHVVREKVCDGVHHLLPINTKSQVADICTKSLIPKLFLHLLSKIGLIDLHAPS